MRHFFNKYKRQANKIVTETTMSAMGVSKSEAQKRVDALLKSGLMETGGTEEIFTQLLIENFMRFDGSKLDYTQVFKETLCFTDLISRYDFEKGGKLTKALEDLKRDKGEWSYIKSEIEKFDAFFHDVIWASLQKGYAKTNPTP